MKGMNILVPTDFSRNADAALKYALGIAKINKSNLIILHAYRLLQTATHSVDQSPFSIKSQWDKETWDRFRNLEKTVIKDSKIHYDFEVDVGFASDAILSSIEANNIDLVIMGTVGAGTMSQVLGSTTLKIISKVKCPVMVVPSDAEYCHIKSVTFAYDNKTISGELPIEFLSNYVKSFSARLQILNVNTDSGKAENHFEDLKNHLSGIDYEFKTVNSKSISDGILNYLKEKPIDLLVTFKRDHSLMEKMFKFSVTRKLVLHSEMPILVLHES